MGWWGKGRGETNVYNSCWMVITVSPCSVLLCSTFSSLFNLSGVPSPLLPVTLTRTHSLVRIPSDVEDFIDSVKGGRKGWGTWVTHTCYMIVLIDLDSWCVEITGFVYTSYDLKVSREDIPHTASPELTTLIHLVSHMHGSQNLRCTHKVALNTWPCP